MKTLTFSIIKEKTMPKFINVRGRKALEKVASWLEAGAPHVDIKGRRVDNFNMNYAVQDNGCGTSCCVAGAVVQFEGLGELNHEGSMLFGGWDAIGVGAGDLAQKYLGISDTNAQRLFMPWDAPEYRDNSFLRENARPFSNTGVAAKTIRGFLATGKVDWVAAGLQTTWGK
jgi:hypothetical protein